MLNPQLVTELTDSYQALIGNLVAALIEYSLIKKQNGRAQVIEQSIHPKTVATVFNAKEFRMFRLKHFKPIIESKAVNPANTKK